MVVDAPPDALASQGSVSPAPILRVFANRPECNYPNGTIPMAERMEPYTAPVARKAMQPSPGRPRSKVKLNRAMALHSGRAPALAKRHLNSFISLEPKVLRGDDPDAIHDLRVASRRLQQILDLLYPKPRTQKLCKLRRTIRRARRSLSVVRNYDVLLSHAESALSRKRLARREVWTVFRDYLSDRRDASFRKAARKLGTLNLTNCFLRIKSLLDAIGPVPADDEKLPDHAGGTPTLETRMIESLRKAWTGLHDRLLESQKESSQTLHPVRIAAKRLRYLIEAMVELHVPGSKPAVNYLRQIQQHLGDWHDLEVLEQVMLAMVADTKFLGNRLPLAIEAERLVLRNRRKKRKYEEEFLLMVNNAPEWVQMEEWIGSLLSLPQPSTHEEV